MLFSEFATQFAQRKYLRKKTVLRIETWPCTGREHLYAEDPTVVARFVSEIKQLAVKKYQARVFLRGQVRDYAGVVPSLFRNATDHSNVDRLLRAYDELCVQLPKLHGQGRFQRPKLGALLQHYGIRTPWLDLVDNLFVAGWFGSHVRDDGKGPVWQRSEMEFGWIHLIATARVNGSKLCVCDLRQEHHPLSVRPHAQHGVSVCLPNRGPDLSSYLAATVRFPMSDS